MSLKNSKKKNQPVFHPLLIGLYPVLALLAYNIIQLDPVYAVRAIVVTLIIAVGVFFLTRLLTREKYKSGLLASLFLILFLTYGHIYNLIENKYFFGHHRYLIALWGLLFILGTWLILRIKKKPLQLTSFLNLFSILLIVIPGYQILSFELRQSQPAATSNPNVDDIWEPSGIADQDSPDVYYIILDAYSRNDQLKEFFGFNNDKFIQELRDLGFYVADCSMSNYSYTPSSMASSLNMDYLDNFASEIIKENRSFYDLGETIKHSKVRSIFETLGYKIVTFDTNIWWLDITDSDLFVSQYQSSWDRILNFKLMGNFEKYYLRTTALRFIEEYKVSQENKFGKALLTTEKAHYDELLYAFDQLEQLPQSESPKFVYAHFVAPHFPYVFNPDGTFNYYPSEHPGYNNEIQYVNQRMMEILKHLINDSSIPPVIILQGDHGLKAEVRNANLSAYYFPNGGDAELYPSITPVNTFRLVFNEYFGADYPLLPDVARTASYQAPYDFSIVDLGCDSTQEK